MTYFSIKKKNGSLTPDPIFFLFCCLLLLMNAETKAQDNEKNTFNDLPDVFAVPQGVQLENKLLEQAALLSSRHPLPANIADWKIYRSGLKKKIEEKTGALLHQDIPLHLKETGTRKRKGFTVKNISFQTRPGVYATANLFIPDGSGQFPAVIVMMGHSAIGRLYDKYQSVGITLALNGYVSLCIDPWGAGERSTVHGIFEDHGDDNNLGVALLDVGETLMGMQITDNIRGVDLLCSLPYVDRQRIGATGASGGGNQTMWLAAMDERIKAAVPVVSVGTFESYIMGTPCFCEVLTDGLTFTEEAAILGCVAPRAIKMCNHSRDANKAFNPREMVRSVNNARPIFNMQGAPKNISYQIFDFVHGYMPEDREVTLGWFNLYLKGIGNGDPVKEIAFETFPIEQLMVFDSGKRDAAVYSTETFCKERGALLREKFLHLNTIRPDDKRKELRNMLGIHEKPIAQRTEEFPAKNGWRRFALSTKEGKLIPVIVHPPLKNISAFEIIASAWGKKNISPALISEYINAGKGVAVLDFSGTGETSTKALGSNDSVGRLRVLSKSRLWMGETVLGEWVKELEVVSDFVQTKFKAGKINFTGDKEAGLAGLFLAATDGNFGKIVLQDAPVSYLFDRRSSVEFFSTGVHLPGFLQWGDVSLAAALSRSTVLFKNPVTLSGRPVTGAELQAFKTEFDRVSNLSAQHGNTLFE